MKLRPVAVSQNAVPIPSMFPQCKKPSGTTPDLLDRKSPSTTRATLTFSSLTQHAVSNRYAEPVHDVEFLQKHKNVVVLKSENDSCQVAIVPDYLSESLSEIDFTKAAQGSGNSDERSSVLVPRQENKFTWIYRPAGDKFYGPDTQSLKEGQWYDEWVPNDHAFVKDGNGKWHIIGITHPSIDPDPKYGDIHQGEYASFHAISSATMRPTLLTRTDSSTWSTAPVPSA